MLDVNNFLTCFSIIFGSFCGFVTFFLLRRKKEEKSDPWEIKRRRKERILWSMGAGVMVFFAIGLIHVLERGGVIAIFPMEECKITGEAAEKVRVNFFSSFSMKELINSYSFSQSQGESQMKMGEDITLIKEKGRKNVEWEASGEKVKEGWWGSSLIDTKTCLADRKGKFVIKLPE